MPEVIASFTYAVDQADFKKVAFTNASQNFTTLKWEFGDGATSTDANPSHTYAAVGDYNVTLTATAQDGKTTDAKTQKVTITDPNAMLTMLVGDVSKTWKLVREGSASAKYYPLEVGPLKADGVTRDGIWWRFGKDEDLAKRPCLLNDEYTFTRAGLAFTRDMKGDFYAGDGGIYNDPIQYNCQTVGADGTGVNKDGADISAWRNFTGTFVLTPATQAAPKSTLKLVGNGAYVGLEKVATHAEVKVPQADVTYDIAKLVEGTVDTLVVVANYNFDADAEMDGYWQFVLVHYDNPGDEPALPGPKPEAGFTAVQSGLGLTLTNTSKYGTSYSWDFGDGSSATTADANHTYAAAGDYVVTMTVTNAQGNATSKQEFYVNATEVTAADLEGGAWKVRAADNSLFVGPAMGSNAWYIVPGSMLTGNATAAGDHWECLADDEFTFAANNVYAYDTKGNVRNDGYFEGLASNGCYSDAELAGVTNDGKKYKTFATHTWAFTASNGATPPKITVTDGSADAKAFIGFYKPYFGGENNDKTKAAGGGSTSIEYQVLGYAKTANKEYLFLSVDISGSKNGSASWSFVLVR